MTQRAQEVVKYRIHELDTWELLDSTLLPRDAHQHQNMLNQDAN